MASEGRKENCDEYPNAEGEKQRKKRPWKWSPSPSLGFSLDWECSAYSSLNRNLLQGTQNVTGNGGVVLSPCFPRVKNFTLEAQNRRLPLNLLRMKWEERACHRNVQKKIKWPLNSATWVFT